MAARAEWRNGPWLPKAATKPRTSRAWVRLQRDPPDMRILAPGRLFFSNNSADRPQAGRTRTNDDHVPIFHAFPVYDEHLVSPRGGGKPTPCRAWNCPALP